MRRVGLIFAAGALTLAGGLGFDRYLDRNIRTFTGPYRPGGGAINLIGPGMSKVCVSYDLSEPARRKCGSFPTGRYGPFVEGEILRITIDISRDPRKGQHTLVNLERLGTR